MGNHINKKVIIAISFATIMVMVGFTGLMYFNPETNTNKINIPKLGYYINKYDFKAVNSVSRTTILNTPDVDNANNTNLTMSYTFYNGTNNVTGELLHVYLNGKLIHESLLINSTDNKNYNCSVVPLYSKSGNYNITTLTNNTNATNNKNNNDVYVDLCGIYSSGSGGRAAAFDQDMTLTLILLMGADSVIMTMLLPWLGAIFGFGVAVIKYLDSLGGDHGIYFFMQHVWWIISYPGINAPYNAVPWDLQNYGSATVTFYNGPLYIP